MKLSEVSIRRPVTILMLVIALLIFGFVSLPKLAVELFPDLNFPVAVVVTSAEGSPPAEVEKLITRPIEEAMGTVPNVKQISSNSAEGASQVIVEFNWGTDLNQATLDMRDKVDLIRGILPDSANSPRILKFDPNSLPIITYSLTGEEDTAKLKSIAEDVIKPRLERIDGVASVSVTGGKERVIDVVLDPDRLAAYGLSIDQVRQALSATNLSGAAGVVRIGDERLSIRVQGEYKSTEVIGETPIPLQQGSIALKHIATVSDTYKEVTQKAYFNGVPSVGISVTKSSGGNTITVADQVKEVVADLQADLPQHIKVNLVSDTSQFVKDSIYTVGEHALIGGFFSVLILYLFLNNFRSTLVASIVLPISVVATFCLMYFTGQTINLISLMGLLLGLGSLVDFAVVILENIFRHRQEGKGMVEAALFGSREVGNAVMASALAQICVFLPIVFVEGIASEIFGPLALTVVYSHIAALVVSMALVPMLSARWLKRIPDEELYHSGKYRGFNPAVWFNIGFEKVAKGYGRFLKWALGHRKTILAATIALFVGASSLVGLVGMEFMPAFDEGKVSISVELPNGTVLEETEKVVAQIEEIAKETPGFKEMYTSIGSGGPANVLALAATNRAQVDVTLINKDERPLPTAEVAEYLREKLAHIAGAEIRVEEANESGGGVGEPIQISLRGDDLDVLEDISSIIVGEVKQVEGTRNVTSTLEEKRREIQVVVDPAKASYYGLTTGQILSSVRTAFQGQTVTTYQTGDDQIDVRLMMPRDFQEDISYLQRLRIPTPGGAQIALTSVASIVQEDVPQLIKRANQTREITITGDIAGRDLGSINRDIQERLSKLNLPDGYSIEFGGQSQEMAESFASLGLAIILSIVLVYMVMAGQFESLFTPFVIMFSIPPTFIGVVVGLLVTGKTLSVPALIGYILLIGIVVNNAIVLIDYVNTLRSRGMERNEAILKAGPLRLRPITMTTLATILAILPLAFGGGEGNESNAPMAVVVVFGLSFSTLITLVLVPVVYTWFDDIGRKFKNRRRKRKATAAEEIPTIG